MKKEAEKNVRVENYKRDMRTMRGAHQDGDEETKFDGDDDIFKPKKPIEEFVEVFAQNTQFFSSYNPDMIEQALIAHLRNNMRVEPEVKEGKYKIIFSLTTVDQGGQ